MSNKELQQPDYNAKYDCDDCQRVGTARWQVKTYHYMPHDKFWCLRCIVCGYEDNEIEHQVKESSV